MGDGSQEDAHEFLRSSGEAAQIFILFSLILWYSDLYFCGYNSLLL